jgi:hypothetical protein
MRLKDIKNISRSVTSASDEAVGRCSEFAEKRQYMVKGIRKTSDMYRRWPPAMLSRKPDEHRDRLWQVLRAGAPSPFGIIRDEHRT